MAVEGDTKDELEDQGWVVGQGKGSKGVFDLMAARIGELRLIECKGTRAGPYAGFGPARRKALKEAAHQAGGTAWLYWNPRDRKGLRRIASSEWPE